MPIVIGIEEEEDEERNASLNNKFDELMKPIGVKEEDVKKGKGALNNYSDELMRSIEVKEEDEEESKERNGTLNIFSDELMKQIGVEQDDVKERKKRINTNLGALMRPIDVKVKGKYNEERNGSSMKNFDELMRSGRLHQILLANYSLTVDMGKNYNSTSFDSDKTFKFVFLRHPFERLVRKLFIF